MRLLLGLLVALIVLLGGLVGFWWFGGPDARRWAANQALGLVLEGDVQIDGTVEVDLGAAPLIRLSGLRVGNPAWAETPNQLQIERAEVQVALRPLLDRVLAFPLIDLKGVTVDLEIAPDGRASWRSEEGGGPGFGPPLLGRMSIDDATVSYHDRRNDRRVRVHLAQLTQNHDNSSGQMSLAATGDVDGDAFSVSGTLGNLLTALYSDAPWPVDLQIALPSLDAKVSGTVADVARESGLDLQLEVQTSSVQSAAEAWHVSLPIDAQTSIKTKVHGDLSAPVFDEIALDVQAAGDSRLTATGSLQLATEQGLRLASGDLSAALAVPQPKAFDEPLGIDAAGLGGLHGEAKLAVQDQAIQVSQLTIDAQDLGALRLTGSGPLATLDADGKLHLAPEISFTAAAATSRPVLTLFDADAAELGPLQASGRLLGDDEGYRLDGIELQLGPADQRTISAQGGLGPLVAGDSLATPLALTVSFTGPSSHTLGPLLTPELSVLGDAKGKLGLGGTLASLKIHDARIETTNAAGVTLVATGGIADLRTEKFEVDGIAFALDGSAPSTTRLTQQLGYDCPDFGAVQTSANLKGGAAPLALDGIKLTVGPAGTPRLEASGAIGDVAALEKVELAGEFRLPTTDLLACFGLNGKSEIGRLHGDVRLSDASGAFGLKRLHAEIEETDLVSLTLDGTIDDLDKLDQVKFQASLVVPKVDDLTAVFDADPIGLEGFRFDGQLSGDAQQFDADGKATLGETKFDGTVKGDLSGARPSLDAHLHSPQVRLADLGLAAKLPPEQPSSNETRTTASGRLFSTQPFHLESLQKIDLDLAVDLDSIEGAILAIDQAKAHVVLTDGKLSVSPARFEVVHGYAQFDGEIDASAPTPTWQIKARADDFVLGDAWRQLQTDVPLGGEVDLVLDLQASGRSPQDLASTLAGNLDLALQRGRINSRLFGLVAMNPLHWLIAGSTRRGYSKIDCFVARFQVDQGVATLQQLLLDTPDVVATGQGTIDLAREKLDVQVHPSAKQHQMVDLATPFAITGSLADPSVEASTVGATARALGRVVATPLNLLGSLLPFINDGGKDDDNPCLNFSAPAAGSP